MNAKELAGSISRFVGQIKPTNNPSDDAVIKGFPEWFIEDLENSATMLRQQADRIAELESNPIELSDEELNKAFDYYCETDEGVLRFNYELRDEWKKEQLSRWKEAFKKAREK